MAKMVIDLSGRYGLAPKHQGDMNDSSGAPQRRYLGADGAMAAGVYNPLRFYGYMSPATNSTKSITESDASDSFTAVIRASIYDSSTQDYFLAENGNNLWYGDDLTDLVLSSAFTGSPIANAVFTDLEVYQVNGTRKLFYAYQKNGGGNIGIAAIPFSGNNNTWLSATCSGGSTLGATNDIFMVPADNGFMYVGDGNALHKIDGTTGGGTNGTAYMNTLVFPVDFVLMDGFDWRGNLWLAMQSATPFGVSGTASYNERVAGVYVWDRQSTQVRMRDFIPIPGVKEIRKIYVAPSGDVRAIVVSSERFVQIRRYNGTTFEIMEELGIAAYPTYRDSVTLMGGLVTWLGADGVFYAHGSIMPGEKEALYKIGDQSAANTNYGAILLADATGSVTTTRTGIYFGQIASGTPTIKQWYPHGQGTVNSVTMNGHAGNIYSLVKFLPKLSTINDITIVCRPTSAGSTTIGTVNVYLNQSSSAFKAHTVTMDLASKGYVHIPMAKPYVNAIQLGIVYPTGTTLGADDFTPAFAIIDYTPTDTFK